MKLVNTENSNTRQLAIIAAAIFVIMSVAKPSSFLSFMNIKSIVIQIADVGLITIGIAIAMITGGIDLSIVAMANLSAIINASLLKAVINSGSSFNIYLLIALCFLISLVLGFLGGLFNGFLVSDMRIPPILATLGTMNLFAGVSMVITTGKGIIGFPDELLVLGSGEVLGIPVPFIIFLAILVLIHFVVNRSAYGLKIKFYGTNSTASLFAGIENRKIIYITYIISGILGAVSGILIMARTNSATVDYGAFIILYSLLAAVMGGISPLGGKGNILNVVLALLVMQLLNSGLNLLRISSFIRETTPGFLLIFIMMGNYYITRVRERQYRRIVESKSADGAGND